MVDTVAAMPSITPRTPTLRRTVLTACLLATALTGLLSSSSAHAADGPQYGSIGQYGEVTRFGGFDSTWFDNGKYDGSDTETQPSPGKFVDPVGFAVDTKDEGTENTAVYVLDRVSGDARQAGASGTRWRLQKLSSTGAPLAATEFYLPADFVSEAEYNVFVGVVGLAVDDASGRIYTILYGSKGKEEGTTRYAEEILAWSTTPTAEGKLVAPTTASGNYPALAIDTVSTPVAGYSAPGVLSTATQLEGAPLYEPQGLALDVTGGQDDLAIEADATPRSGGGALQGPGVVEQLSTESPETGDELGDWSTATGLTGVINSFEENATATAAGISTNPDGSLNVLLSGANEDSLPDVDVVDLSADLADAGPKVLSSSSIDPSIGYADPIRGSNQASGVKGIGQYGSGNGASQVVNLSNGLYAADFSENPGDDYWASAENEGIRLVEPEASGLLSNATTLPTSIFDTLGNATSGGSCNISSPGESNGVSLAAGADGTLWALTAGEDTARYQGEEITKYTSDRQVIEFSPNVADSCVAPVGTFSLAKEGGSSQQASEPLKVPIDSTVDFDAAGIDYPTNNGKPSAIYAYEWDPTGAGYTTINESVTDVGGIKDETVQPVATASHQYTTPGVYPVKLKLLGDFGEYDEEGSVVVQTTNPPTAAFTAPSTAQTGQSISFDASASQPASGAQIADYQWKFGDGQTDETQNPADSHIYASPGTYTISLLVHDNDDRISTAVTQQITVTSPPSTGNEEGSGGGNTGSGTGSGGALPTTVTPVSVTTTPPATTSTSKPKPLTTAQKLASALKQCKKDKTKKQRANCEKQAKKKYTTKPKPKKKSKKTGKKK